MLNGYQINAVQFQLSSTNPAVYDYQLLPGTIGVDEGYFTLESGGEVGDRDADLFQERKLDRETYPNFTIFARAFDAQGNIVIFIYTIIKQCAKNKLNTKMCINT